MPDGSKKITYAVTGHGGSRTQVHFSSRSACEATLRELTAGQRIRVEKGQTFAQALRHKYKTRLHFVDIEAMRIVDNFNLPCPQPDGRYLPLTNVLFAKLAQADTPKAWLKIVADSHGGSVRIRDQLTGPSGPLDAPYVSMEVTGNGELRIFDGVRMEAILNSCFGVNGDIFVVPRRAAGAAK